MERIFYLLKQSLFIKLALVATLVIGGGNSVWGEELTVNGGASNTAKYLPIYVEGAATFNSKGEYIIPNDLLENVIGKKITKLSYEVSTKATGTGKANYAVYLDEVSANVYPSSGYDFMKSNSSVLVYTGALDATGETMDIEMISDFVYSGTGNLLIYIECVSTGDEGLPYFRGRTDYSNYRGLYTGTATGKTRSAFVPKTTITYEDVPEQTNPKLEVSPSSITFGAMHVDGTTTITVTNTGVGTMDVTIASDNTADFTLSTTSLTEIGAGESQTFNVTFNYDSSNLGEKDATITVTPSYNINDAVTINVTANAVSDNDPQLSVSPDENVNLGDVYRGEATFTVTNIGTGQMSVNIASDNSDFIVTPSKIEGLGNNQSGTFTVSYTFGAIAEKIGVNNASITVTPTYSGGVVKTYQVSATSNASMTLDEDNVTTVNYGTKDYILVKYQPSAGWNTISMPFVLRTSLMNNMDAIFGVGWKAYTLSSYSNGTLSFSKVSESANVNYGTPYLVYISDAPVHPNGVLLADISTYGNNPSSTSKNGITFQGTYVRKDYVDGDDWYGVTSSGQVLQAGEGAYVKGYRAYFTGIQPPTNGARVSIVLEGDGTTTDLGFVKMVDKDATDVYTLSGQKVQKAGKGLYIVNGRKVVIK